MDSYDDVQPSVDCDTATQYDAIYFINLGKTCFSIHSFSPGPSGNVENLGLYPQSLTFSSILLHKRQNYTLFAHMY